MTPAGRAALLLMIAWLLAALVLLAVQGLLVGYLIAVGAATGAGLGLRALVRQQRAPSILDRDPDRYRVADDLTKPIASVIQAAEAEA
jgi:hypothetical protein